MKNEKSYETEKYKVIWIVECVWGDWEAQRAAAAN